jgi:hypothetical protein
MNHALALLLACALASTVHANEPKKDDPPKQPDPAPTPAPPPAPDPKADAPTPAPEGAPDASPEKLPTLDELLGLDNPADERTKGLLEDYDPDKVQLERKLTDQEAAEKLEQAVQQMHETAFRLEQIRDPGIVTQRLQAEILTKLDVLIKNAESQQQSSGQSQQSQSQQQQQQQQQTPPKGDAAQQQSQEAGAQDGGGNPAFQEGQRDQLDAARAAWGALPDRVRDRLMEGSSDYFSEWYRSLTEAYYKRIAEEASK